MIGFSHPGFREPDESKFTSDECPLCGGSLNDGRPIFYRMVLADGGRACEVHELCAREYGFS